MPPQPAEKTVSVITECLMYGGDTCILGKRYTLFVEMHHKTGILSAKLLVYYLIFLEICHTMCIKS